MTGGAPTGRQAAATAAWRAMRAMVLDNDRRREVCDALGMSFVRAKALLRLDDAPLSMAELAGALAIDAPYATVVVDDLEARGLVTRRPHPSDRRAKLVAVTPAGSEAAGRTRAILEAPPEALRRLDPGDLRTLARLLAHALNGAEQPGGAPAPAQ